MNPILEQLRLAIEEKHRDALAALKQIGAYLGEPLPVVGTGARTRFVRRARGTDTKRARVLKALQQVGRATNAELQSVTGLPERVVGSVLAAVDLRHVIRADRSGPGKTVFSLIQPDSAVATNAEVPS